MIEDIIPRMRNGVLRSTSREERSKAVWDATGVSGQKLPLRGRKVPVAERSSDGGRKELQSAPPRWELRKDSKNLTVSLY